MPERKFSAYLIDPPSPFETTETWVSFLKQMESLPQDDPGVAAEVEWAREILEERKAGDRNQ